MLPKFEYGHLYKFAVSLGLLMVALGLALPWLVLRESGSLLIPESELDALTAQARRVLLRKQGDHEWIAGHYRYASLVLVVTGLAVGSFGFAKWARRQSVADEIEDTQRDTAQAHLRQLTPTEANERLDQESAEVLAEESAPLKVEGPGERQRHLADLRQRIQGVEQHALAVIRAEFQSTHLVRTQVHLFAGEASASVDALVLAIDPADTSYAIEIKFLQRAQGGLIVKRLRDAIPDVALAAETASRAVTTSGEKVAGIVLLVMAEEPTDHERSIVNRQVKRLRSALVAPVGVIATSQSALVAPEPGWLRRAIEDAL